MASTDTQQPETGRADSGSAASGVLLGAASGVIATALFVAVHQLLILNIWAMFIPMAIAGGLCGAVIAWSYRKAVANPSIARWFAFNGVYTASLLLLGAISLAWFKPEWTFAELNVENPPLGDLFARATPLMIVFSILGALVVWLVFGSRRSALLPIILSESVLVLLVGHNVAIIGLVDLTVDGWALVWLMLGLVLLLGVVFASVFAAIDRFMWRLADW